LPRWCITGQGATLPGLLTQAQAWLVPQLQPTPANAADWLELWRTPLATWWPLTLPAAWEGHWRLLSRREATLTAEALAYLETHRPGAIAVDKPAAPDPLPLPIAVPETHPTAPDMMPRWSLNDLVMCVTRELRRREQAYPQLVQKQRLTSE